MQALSPISMGLRIGSLCSGYGGLDMAVQRVFSGELAWWSDIEPGPIRVMSHHHPGVPNIGDLKTAPWHVLPPIDILTGGYPCQPFSNAGKRLGTDDPRHLWPWIAHAIGSLRPVFVVLENVAAHLRRGFDVVLEDLATLGYDARWLLVRASDIGACHRRERLFIVASDTTAPDTNSAGSSLGTLQSAGCQLTTVERGHRDDAAADPVRDGRYQWGSQHAWEFGGSQATCDSLAGRWGDYWPAVERHQSFLGRPVPEPTVTGTRGARVLSPYLVEWMMGLPGGYVTAVPGLTRNQQLRLLGNGVMPQQAEYALRELMS